MAKKKTLKKKAKPLDDSGSKESRFNFRIQAEYIEKIKRLAHQKGLTASMYARMVVIDHLNSAS